MESQDRQHSLFPNILDGTIVNGDIDAPNKWITGIQSYLSVSTLSEANSLDTSEYFLGHECRVEDVAFLLDDPQAGIFSNKMANGQIAEWLTLAHNNRFYCIPQLFFHLPPDHNEAFNSTANFSLLQEGIYMPLPISQKGWCSSVAIQNSSIQILSPLDVYALLADREIHPNQLHILVEYQSGSDSIVSIFPARYINYNNHSAGSSLKYIQPISGQTLLAIDQQLRIGYIGIAIPLGGSDHKTIIEFTSLVFLDIASLCKVNSSFSSLEEHAGKHFIPTYSLTRRLQADVYFFCYQ
ncbi:hypothetical protein [Prochlorococcus sp. MIT 1306]|uniref:hypothetical protein n=1 Tax=Prochlorococcus sp. MIT 1306 TaxID=1799667 RepID=UPI0007BC6183|nr:hypothetical protein [Prochlorococcus sp. MIT 1306]KZR61436.1 hypothetical protein PMIT1306_02217 [Prochlorococcus sp. MIT 1306]